MQYKIRYIKCQATCYNFKSRIYITLTFLCVVSEVISSCLFFRLSKNNNILEHDGNRPLFFLSGMDPYLPHLFDVAFPSKSKILDVKKGFNIQKVTLNFFSLFFFFINTFNTHDSREKYVIQIFLIHLVCWA